MNSHGASGHPHIIPLRTYLTIGAALLVFTAITIAVSFLHLGPFNIVVALAIATIKALLVAFFFMHLYYDNKFYFMVFTIGVLFLAVFIGFTMIDTMRRADLYEEVSQPIIPQVDYSLMRDSTGSVHHQDSTGRPHQADTSKEAAKDSAGVQTRDTSGASQTTGAGRDTSAETSATKGH